MVELRKTGANQYEVVVDEQIIGQVWNWHGSWSAQTGDKTYHNHKRRYNRKLWIEDSLKSVVYLLH